MTPNQQFQNSDFAGARFLVAAMGITIHIAGSTMVAW
jgi:hypothetical protein